MKTIAVLSQKGGAGKTTIAINLAVAANTGRRQSAIIDLDPQASATSWHDSRSSDTPPVVSAQASRIEQVISVAANAGANLVIIDTAPHSESASLAAARAADLVLIPCRPAILDLRAIANTIDLARLAKTPAFVILNSVPPRGSLADEASEAIASFSVEVAPVRVGQRAAFVHSITSGQSVQEYESHGKAAKEVSNLYVWVCKRLNN